MDDKQYGRTGSKSISHFQVGKEIGKGSFAQVYYGWQKDTGAAVAIKIVEITRLNSKLKENLHSEIQILKTLRHPHIVALHDCVRTSSTINLVMEYCELGDLSLFIRKRDQLETHPATIDITRKYPSPANGGLHEVVIRHFMQQLASALKFLRDRNYIHRDVKPQNLLLLPSPRYRNDTQKLLEASRDSLIPAAGVASLPMLKLADFGFARVLPATSMAETLCGSPLYMAPEILRYESYSAKADLWSVGTVAYEMVCAKPPFRARNHVELLKKIQTTDDVIRFPKGIVVSSDMKQLIRSLLRQKPVERMGFDEFFQHPVMTDEIPGLVEDDVQASISSSSVLGDAETRFRELSLEYPTLVTPALRQTMPRPSLPDTTLSAPVQPVTANQASPPPPVPDATHKSMAVDELGIRKDNVVLHQQPRTSQIPRQENPSSPDNPSFPENPGYLRQDPNSVPRETPAVRRVPERSNSLREAGSREAGSRAPGSRLSRAKPSPDPTAEQEMAFEKEYVVVEKGQVEVNAFADEMAAKHRFRSQVGTGPGVVEPNVNAQRRTYLNRALTTTTTSGSTKGRLASGLADHERKAQQEQADENTSPQNNSTVRRSASLPITTSHPPTSSSPPLGSDGRAVAMAIPSANVSSSSSPGRAISSAQGRRSYERTFFGGSPQFVTSISQAISGARRRLFGYDAPQSLHRAPTGTSPPRYFSYQQYNALTSTGQEILAGDGKSIDDDTKAFQKIEDLASRSEAIYLFAEVKYKQILPLTPLEAKDAVDEVEELNLTPEAVVAIAEEALVLYVKVLTTLAKSMDVAGTWWNLRNRLASGGGGGDTNKFSTSSPSAAHPNTISYTAQYRINGAVQWIRHRFNDVIEKIEAARRQLEKAQSELPRDHPNHPRNHRLADREASDVSSSSSNASNTNAPNTKATSVIHHVYLTPGLSAEKLLYERALDMSRAAAIDEISNQNLPNCASYYITAIRMVEAVLDDEDASPHRPSSSVVPDAAAPQDADDTSGGGGPGGALLEKQDREVVEKMHAMISERLAIVQRRIHAMEEAERLEKAQQLQARRVSGEVPRNVRSAS